jgi:hypothetical protein
MVKGKGKKKMKKRTKTPMMILDPDTYDNVSSTCDWCTASSIQALIISINQLTESCWTRTRLAMISIKSTMARRGILL